LDRPLDDVLGTAIGPGLVNGVAELQVHVGVAAAMARGHENRPAELGEQPAALRVDNPLPVRDVRRVRMTSHCYGGWGLGVRGWGDGGDAGSKAGFFNPPTPNPHLPIPIYGLSVVGGRGADSVALSASSFL